MYIIGHENNIKFIRICVRTGSVIKLHRISNTTKDDKNGIKI